MKHTSAQDLIQLKVLRLLHENPDLSQRGIAQKLGVSLGSINFCLQALVEKGWVKLNNFSQSSHKLGYVYLLTPAGIASKSMLAAGFLKRKLKEYEQLQAEIEALRLEIRDFSG